MQRSFRYFKKNRKERKERSVFLKRMERNAKNVLLKRTNAQPWYLYITEKKAKIFKMAKFERQNFIKL